jgi:hypothetical protein
MNNELTSFDKKFLSDCGVATASASASDEQADKTEEDQTSAMAIYYRRIVEELG